MGDGVVFRVLCPYSLFCRRWSYALVGGRLARWRMTVVSAVLRPFGVWYVWDPSPKFMPVVRRLSDGTLRRCYLNPTQITYAEQPGFDASGPGRLR